MSGDNHNQADEIHLPTVGGIGYRCSCGFKVAGVRWEAARWRMWDHIRTAARGEVSS